MYGRLQRRFNQSVHTDPYRLFILLSHVCFRQLELARATVAQNAETTLPAREQVLTPPPPHLSTRHPPNDPHEIYHKCELYTFDVPRRFV